MSLPLPLFPLLLVAVTSLGHTRLASQSSGGASAVPSGAGTSPGSPRPGAALPKPGGGTFFLDGHRSGSARELFLEEVVQGRLVDVHGLDALGAFDPTPVFRDFLVGESVQSDGADYLLYTSPSTQVAHLVVLRQPGAPEPSPGTGTFLDLVRAAERAAEAVPPRAPSAPLVPTVPRNAVLGLRFSDLLDDGPAASAALAENVRVVLGMPPSVPFAARLRFDPNHGGTAQGAFHATRVLVDPTVSEFEAAELATPLPINALGLPASPTPSGASFALHLPTRLDPGAGQFTRLANLAGRGLASSGNGPVDPQSSALVRAARAASESDANAGFLLDLEPPSVVGEIPVRVVQAATDPSGESGFAFLVDWTFLSPCADRPRLGDALETGGLTLEVVETGAPPDPSGTVHGVRVRLAQRTPTASGALLGNGLMAARLRPDVPVSPCWFGVSPAPARPPGRGLSTSSSFRLRFSEPLRLEALDPYDNFRLVRGPAGTPADAGNTVVVELQPSSDVSRFVLSPVLPLEHVQGESTPYHLEVLGGPEGPTDLVGNALAAAPSAEVRIARSEADESSAGVVLRFSAVDEAPGPGADLRGDFALDPGAGLLHARPPSFFSAVADRTNPVPSIMIPFPSGVQTPLSPLGSKLHSVWRYADLGWSVHDETKYDVDVVGLSWAPPSGMVLNDFFPQFEIRLAHARRLPDEALGASLLPRWPASGLVAAPRPYAENVLDDPASPQEVVHPRSLGYRVSAADLFVSDSGTVMLPYPLNRGPGALATYTWRDTSVLSKAGPDGAGVPLDVEVGPPLFLEPKAGALAAPGGVPSIGLPLLMEYRCYPTDAAIGLNALDVNLAVNSSALPAFRSFSTGGVDSSGQVVAKDPDLEDVPSGGFNPSSSPPGLPTRSAENTFYIGQVDLVYRVTRVHSAWLDSGAANPDYFALQLGASLPGLAGATAELRGATGFSGTGGAESDATGLDAYGELRVGAALFHGGDAGWHAQPDDIDGARFAQVRLTLINDLAAGASPALDFLALAFRR
jgi:hypothetical protein